MKSSKGRASPAAGKRRKPGAPGSRARKKQKRLDAICDRPETPVGTPSPYRNPAAEARVEPDDPGTLRRSTRARRAPAILDSSPVPSHRKRGKRGGRGAQSSGGNGGKRLGKRRNDVVSVDNKVKKEIKFEEEADKPIDARGFSEDDASDWSSRLRSRVRKGRFGSHSPAGERKLSYQQPDELCGAYKDYSKPKEEATENVDSVPSESSRKERRRRKRRRRRSRKLNEREIAPLVLDVKKEEESHDKTLAEEVVAVFSSSDNDGEKNIPEDEDGVADEASLGDERKVVDEKMFPQRKNEVTYEEASLQGVSKIAARRGISDDERDARDKALLSSLEGNNRADRKEPSKSKIAATEYMPENRRVTGEKALSYGQTKTTHEEPTSQAEGKITFVGDMLQDGRAAGEKAFSETGNVGGTLKASSEYGSKISLGKVLQEDKEKIIEEASLEEESRTLGVGASVDKEGELAVNSVPDGECEDHVVLVGMDQTYREQDVKFMDQNGSNSPHMERENIVNVPCRSENGVTDQRVGTQINSKLETRVSEGHNILKQENSMRVHQVDTHDRPRVKEGRRCGLCGGGSDGKPPKKLILECADSDNEPYNGSSSSEEPNYDLWDGFGDEPEWLGRLLGPIRDRFGMARVWVHQQCAVWSPEVYFAGLGHLKSVRAALCRGRALKCSRCGRPGATIGCRVDRCPKTYHLPCARAENCIFDHRKFLIACTDHRHIFQPQGNHYSKLIRKMKRRKMRLDMRKLSNESWRKDLEAEDKWLENCGEDEEFLKREGKRLHRDMLRVTPVYIGGSCSEKEKSYQGWESVAGLQDVIQCMKEVIILPLLYPELFSSLGLTPPRGVLLHGYPGTGKTLVVRALIGECARGDKRIAYFARKGADCLGKYVGDAERQLRLLFQVAERCQPSIIFFDEIDGLAPCRSKQLDQTHNSVVSTLLSLLDGLKSRGSVVVIGATNRPDAVDPALRRPGRFDREIYFPLPSVKDRSAILSLQTKNWPKPLSGPVLSWIANQTAGFAGADLQSLCTQAAIIALKRNCPLHDILASAEKGSSDNGQPSLPSFTVEEKDWLAALACAPPPCSQREAGMAANDVVTAPLPEHLVPCLLKPLSYILISFVFDERIWMPPALFKASKSIKDVICSALQQMGFPIMSWKSHLHHLIKKSDIANEIERNLCCFGLLSSASSLGAFCTLDNDHDDEHDKFYSQGLQTSHSSIHSFTSPHVSFGLEKPSGFRVLVAGAPRCGQQHLASCLLHQFLGRIEIQKVNLATISQEGHGDITYGITQILLKCGSVGRCVVYLPRLDLWAVEEVDQQESEESTGYKSFKSSQRGSLDNVARHSSQAWDSFVEQLDSMSRSSSLIVLATCEMENHDLPVRIREFFTTNVLRNVGSTASEHTIPRFCVQVDGNFEHCLMINSAIVKISRDLVQQYIQLIHQRSHVKNVYEELNVCYDTKLIHKRKAALVGKSEGTDKICTTIDLERTPSNHEACLRDGHGQEPVNVSKRQNLFPKINQEDDFPLQRHQDSLLRFPSNKITKGNSMFMIATLGYQILQYPQFAELCWVTSKLKEGPCADISGPWTVWPFNSCIVDANNSTDKAACPLITSNMKDKESCGVVRGLVAVGLLAYRGAYTSVKEVSSEVRKVLELLVRLISVRIQNGKDRYRFVRLLSQVAYLDDMINSWAYASQSLQVDNRSQISASNSRPVISGEMDKNDGANSCKLRANDASVSNKCDQSCDAMQEMMQIKSNENCPTSNGEHSNTSNCIVPEAEAPCGMFSSAPSLTGEETCRSENPDPCSSHCKGLELSDRRTGLPMTESTPFVANLHNMVEAFSLSCSSRDVRELCDGLGGVDSSTSERLTDEQIGDERNDNSLSSSEKLCLYDICGDCLQSLHVLIQEILSTCLESTGHSPTVDDVHKIVTSCSLNLVAAIRKHFFSQGCYRAEACLTEDCVLGHVDVIKLKKTSHSPRQLEHMNFFPNECCQHQRDEVSLTTENPYDNSPVRPELKLLFRDGILLPSNPREDVVVHCNFERLSIQAIIEIISSTKQPYV